MRGKPSKSQLKKKALALWSQLILSKGQCEICGKPGTNPHHIIGRKNLTLRYDLRNGCCLCFTHHLGGQESAHNDPIWFMGWLMQNRPDDYNYLFDRRGVITDFIDYEVVIERLKNDCPKNS